MVPGPTPFQARQNRTTQRQTLPKTKKRPPSSAARRLWWLGIMGSHPLPVSPPLHHYRILIHHLPHRGSRHHSASASSRHRFHFRILTAPVPMTWLQESAVTVNTVDTTGRARQLAAVPPSRCRAGRVRRAEPLFREATDSHVTTWDVLRPVGTTATPSVWRMAPTRSLPAGARCAPACRPSPP